MKTSITIYNSGSRLIWLRQGGPSNPDAVGKLCTLKLSAIGNAAARETLITDTSHMAAIWTDLFHSLMVPGSPYLCWRDKGPGISRDARIAYSSLLGRYMARAYLTEHEGIRILVPLDVAKDCLYGTPYAIKKDPAGRGLEADWIGLDDTGLVIVEAKGTYDRGIKTWCGPGSVPQILQTAIKQAERTAVFSKSRGKLPAKRWAIASRWGTENNGLEPTLLAWDPEEEKLDKDDYRTLASIFHRADVDGVIRGMGHNAPTLDAKEVAADSSAFARLRMGAQLLEPGYAAMVGPFGVYPLRTQDDNRRLRQAREMGLSYSIVLLSLQYASASSETLIRYEELEIANLRSANRYGLTVVWPGAEDDIYIEEE